MAAWWCNNHLEKYQSIERIIPYIYIMENKKMFQRRRWSWYVMVNWLVVEPTPLKNMSQLE